MRKILLILFVCCTALIPSSVWAQELDASVTFNTRQIEGTNTAIFDNLQRALTDFLNERQWTHLQFRRAERIRCTFNFTVQQYDEVEHRLNCALTVTATRPIYNASYTSTTFSTRDANVIFRFQEFDKLEFRPETIDNDLTAIMAYYVYLIIGWDLDTMSTKGGTEEPSNCRWRNRFATMRSRSNSRLRGGRRLTMVRTAMPLLTTIWTVRWNLFA